MAEQTDTAWSRMWQALGAIVLLVSASGCTSTPSGPIVLEESTYKSPTLRADHNPWGTLAVRFVRDTRPGWELGFENYLNDSYYSDELFELGVPVTLKRLILKEMQLTGSFEPEQDPARSKYVAELTLNHFYIRTNRDIWDLIPLLPTTTVEAVVDFKVKLVDQDGRLFLQRRYDSAAPERQEFMRSLSGSGVNQLLAILSRFMAELTNDLDQSVPIFWRELGLPIQ